MENILVFDLETQKGFNEIGRDRLDLMQISIGCIYKVLNNQYCFYTEEEVDKLIEELKQSTQVIGFNLIDFDYLVLKPYSNFNLNQLNTLDLMLKVKEILGFRVSLDNLTRSTLGEGKVANGYQALIWVKEGNWEKLKKYCQEDVRLTYELYKFGKEKGYVNFKDKDEIKKIFISW